MAHEGHRMEPDVSIWSVPSSAFIGSSQSSSCTEPQCCSLLRRTHISLGGKAENLSGIPMKQRAQAAGSEELLNKQHSV